VKKPLVREINLYLYINITAEPFLRTIRRKHIYSSIGDSEVVLVSERNDAGLMKLSQVLSKRTSDSPAFLNAMRLLKLRTQV
jgi:hypothetical protein